MTRTVLLCFVSLLGVALHAPFSTATPADEAEQVAERLLSAVGGRQAWAGMTSSIVYTQRYGQNEPDAVDAIITTDYARRRVRIDAIGSHLHLVRVVDSEKTRDWRLDGGSVREQGSADLLGRELGWDTGHAVRTLQRVAVRDPALKLSVVHKGGLDGLEVHERGARIAWYRLDARNEPIMMGLYDDNIGVICGPWDVERDRIRFPAWVVRPDGSWRVTVKSLAVNVGTDERLFSQPVVASQSGQ